MWNCVRCGKELPRYEDREFIGGQEFCHSCYEKENERQLHMRRLKEIEERKRKEEMLYKKKLETIGISSFIRALGDSSPKQRANAAHNLGILNDKRAVGPLLEALKDGDSIVIKEVVSALGKIGDTRALDELRKLQKQLPSNLLIDETIQNLQKIKFENMARITENSLTEMSWQNFEDRVIEALGATPSDKRSGDLGIDGITSKGIPIQIKQSEHIGRNVVDNFETALRRYYPTNTKVIRGIIVAISFTKGAYDEVSRAKHDNNIDIHLLTIDELLIGN